MSDPKTRPTGESVAAFLAAIEDRGRREDCKALAAMMRELTGKRARMWGESIVGFGSYHYRYASGREGDWFMTGFSPRRRDLSVYVMPHLAPYEALLGKLGRHRSGACCVYLKRLDDVDRGALRELLGRALQDLARTHPCR